MIEYYAEFVYLGFAIVQQKIISVWRSNVKLLLLTCATMVSVPMKLYEILNDMGIGELP